MPASSGDQAMKVILFLGEKVSTPLSVDDMVGG